MKLSVYEQNLKFKEMEEMLKTLEEEIKKLQQQLGNNNIDSKNKGFYSKDPKSDVLKLENVKHLASFNEINTIDQIKHYNIDYLQTINKNDLENCIYKKDDFVIPFADELKDPVIIKMGPFLIEYKIRDEIKKNYLKIQWIDFDNNKLESLLYKKDLTKDEFELLVPLSRSAFRGEDDVFQEGYPRWNGKAIKIAEKIRRNIIEIINNGLNKDLQYNMTMNCKEFVECTKVKSKVFRPKFFINSLDLNP